MRCQVLTYCRAVFLVRAIGAVAISVASIPLGNTDAVGNTLEFVAFTGIAFC